MNAGTEFRENVCRLTSSHLLAFQSIWSISPSFLTGFHSVPRIPFSGF